MTALQSAPTGGPVTAQTAFEAGGRLGAELSGLDSWAWIRRRQTVIAGILAVLVGIGIWQATGLVMKPIFISTPSLVAPALWHLVVSGPLPSAFLLSLLEMIGGLVIATIVGIGVGMSMGRVRFLERALGPLVAFGNGTPSVALLPVMEVWFGFGEEARVAFIMVIA
ncbi:MAG: ABC transporter permease, partial [Acidimicrobiales bacterium]